MSYDLLCSICRQMMGLIYTNLSSHHYITYGSSSGSFYIKSSCLFITNSYLSNITRPLACLFHPLCLFWYKQLLLTFVQSSPSQQVSISQFNLLLQSLLIHCQQNQLTSQWRWSSWSLVTTIILSQAAGSSIQVPVQTNFHMKRSTTVSFSSSNYQRNIRYSRPERLAIRL